MSGHFTPAFFKFFRSLKRHNEREWFEAHRDQFVRDVEAPLQQFIADFAPRLKTISRAFIADPRRMGGSMFRIHRDTRFSADKSPYKTWMAARFRHEASKKGDSAPGFYLHMAVGDVLGGGGLYHAELPAVNLVRQRIVDAPKVWAEVRKSTLEDDDERLKRPPAGFDPAHRFIDDIKRRNFFALTTFTEADAVGADFLDRFTSACADAAPVVEFVAKALNLRW